jgi:hypothetical protein
MFSKLFYKIHFKIKNHRRLRKPLVPLTTNGGGCLATDRIIVEGNQVGFMYRVKPDPKNKLDNGWRFFAGDESQEYINNLTNTHPYDLNTIANHDPAILPYLNSSYNTAFERIPNSRKFKKVDNFDFTKND